MLYTVIASTHQLANHCLKKKGSHCLRYRRKKKKKNQPSSLYELYMLNVNEDNSHDSTVLFLLRDPIAAKTTYHVFKYNARTRVVISLA